MEKAFSVLFSIVFSVFLFNVCEIRAEGEAPLAVNSKQGLISDKQQIKEQQEISQDAQAAERIEENQLREQIKTAIKSGDLQTAQQLKQQLRAMHVKNIEAMMEGEQAKQSAKKGSNPSGPVGGADSSPDRIVTGAQ